MPATTPNRGYPYPLPADPVDVPGDICRLAQAVNNDLLTVQGMVQAKPMAQMRSSQPQAVPTAVAVPGTIPLTPLVFDSVDFDSGGYTNITTQPTLLTLTVGPAYWVWATVRFPQFTKAPTEPSVTFRVTSNDATPLFVDNEMFQIDGTVFNRTHTIGGLYIPTAGDESIQALVAHNSDNPTEVFTEASFGVMQIRPVA